MDDWVISGDPSGFLGPIALLPFSITALLMGVLLLDLAVQAVHVANLSVVVALHPEKSGRLIGGYMIFYSVGSAIEAIAATAIYARSGWPGISFLGTTFSGVALAIWITPIFSERRSRNSSSLGLLEEERFGRLTAVQTQQQLAARDRRPTFSAKILYGRLAGSGEASISDLM